MATGTARYMPGWIAGERVASGDEASSAAIGAGAGAGLIGGVIVAMMEIAHGAAVGIGMLVPLKAASGLVYGAGATDRGISAMIVGVLVYLLVPLGLGAVFGVFVGRRFSVTTALAYGLVWGILIWAAVTWVALPRLNPPLAALAARYPAWWLLEHLVFGASLMLTPPIAHAVAGSFRPMVLPPRSRGRT
jgi:hypothetical protein